MANRNFNRHQSLEKEIKSLQLKFETDGSGDVSSFSGLGVASVSHAANVYTITLDDAYVEFKHALAISGVAANWTVNSEDVAGAKTIVIESSAAQASTNVYVNIELKNSSAL